MPMAKKKKITIASPHRTFLFIAIAGVAIGYLFGGLLVPQSQIENDGSLDEVVLTDNELEEILEAEANADNSPDQLSIIEDVSVDDDPFQGNVDAPVTIIEFSDFQCPFCKRYFEESYSTIIEDYVETGQVHYVYRDFPLDSHPQAVPAAIAANCAREQDHYWEMHDLLLENQDDWSFQPSAEQIFQTYAATLELDPTEFSTCVNNNQIAQEILSDQEDGAQATVEQTPTIFINGKKIIGAQPLETYIAIIEAELIKADQ